MFHVAAADRTQLHDRNMPPDRAMLPDSIHVDPGLSHHSNELEGLSDAVLAAANVFLATANCKQLKEASATYMCQPASVSGHHDIVNTEKRC